MINNNCDCKINQSNIIEMMVNYQDYSSNYELVSNYYTDSKFNIEEFKNMNNLYKEKKLKKKRFETFIKY